MGSPQTPKIKRHPDGTRYVQPYLGTNRATGRPMRPYHRFPDDMTDEQVAEEARTWLAEISAGLKVGTTIRLTDLLTEFVNRREVEGAAANSVKTWRMYVRNYLGALARRDPRGISTADVSDLYNMLITLGGKEGKPLSPNTVQTFHWFLCSAWDWLIQMGICETNPARAARRPKPEQHEAVSLARHELAVIGDALDAELEVEPTDAEGIARRVDAFAAWLALNTGMRCGEVCALRRMDLNLDCPSPWIKVCGTVTEAKGLVRKKGTKSGESRSVALFPANVPVVMRHLAWQDELLGGRDRKRTLVSTDGGLRSPSTVSRGFSRIAKERGLPPKVTFHSLRHTHGTWLLSSGIEVQTVAERLGHKDKATTLRYYAHVLPGRDAAAADAFAMALDQAGGRS